MRWVLTTQTMTWGEEPGDRWLQREKAAVPAGSDIHLIEGMLFRSPKVTFGSAANGAFEDALDIQSAIVAERSRAWWSQVDTVRYMSCSGESLVQLAASMRMIMALESVDRMIIYRPAADSEALTTVYEKDHTEKILPGLEADVPPGENVRRYGSCNVGDRSAVGTHAKPVSPQGEKSKADAAK